jgi:hypothetical protein
MEAQILSLNKQMFEVSSDIQQKIYAIRKW